MNTKRVLEELELSEANAAASNSNLFWHPDSAASNINRSLHSIDSSDRSNKNIPTHIYHSKKPENTSQRSSIFGKSNDSVDNSKLFSGSRDSYSTSTASYHLLRSLKPHESLPNLDSPASDDNKGSSVGSKSSSVAYSTAPNIEGKKPIEEGTYKRHRKSKMEDEPEVDYGMTVRNEVEQYPDYDLAGVRENTRGATKNPGDARSRHADTSQPVMPDRKHNKVPGGVRLPIAGDLGVQSSPVKRGYASPRRRQGKDADKREAKAYPESIQAEDVKDLAKLSVLKEDTINTCLQARYKEDLIYTRCGDIMISVNPFKNLGIYTKKAMASYSHTAMSEDPHIYMISAKAYQDLTIRNTDQVILVSGESGAGKTEATKLLVQHLVSMAGSADDALQDKIIQVNPLLENFGNAKTVLNNNSSRFAKFLRLNYNHDYVVQSAKIQDFMLEKSRVIHYQKGESTYHSFYALLAGLTNSKALYINPGQTFRITGDFSSTKSRHADSYCEMYKQQQMVFQLIDMEQEERDDVDVILAAILHIGEIQFKDDDNDCVIITNEDTVQKVANLLDVDSSTLTKALIERRGKVKDEFIQFSKKTRQADDERDALAKTLYEKLFGWIVRKINDALVSVHTSRSGSIGILDICGFEDLHKNTFEQMCINIINEHLQNFMNKKVIEDEKDLYELEGIPLGDIHTEGLNNDAVLAMFTKKYGILYSIDEDSKIEVASDDVKMVRKLDAALKDSNLYIPSTSNRPEFSIRHFAGKVTYDGRSFIQKNCDTMGDLLEECLKESGSSLVNDLFHVQPSFTGSISMSQFKFQGSRRSGHATYKPLTGVSDLSRSISQSTRASLKHRFGAKMPSFKSDLANKKTHIHYFKNSLDELHQNMAKAIPYFVRCIKPNDYLKSGRYDAPRVLTQLKYNGITEVARIRSCGLPVRMSKQDFCHRYGDLVGSRDCSDGQVHSILDSIDAQTSDYKIGNTQVFMTNVVQSSLDEDLSELRRKQEEERIRQEEEKRKREEKERIIRARQEREEREKEEMLAQKRRAEENEKKRRLAEEKENEEKRRQEEERKKEVDKFRKDLKKSVNFMDVIDEAPTPASSTYDSNVYNRTADSSISSDDTVPKTLGMSTETSITVVEETIEDDDDDDEVASHDYNESEWMDHFQELTEEEVREDLSDLRTLKVIKVILYIFLAMLLLVSLVVQKVSFITLALEVGKSIGNKQTVAYVLLIITVCIPYAVGFFLSVLKMLFSISKSPSVWTWIWVLSIESLHSFGMCLLVFRVMRHMDYFKAAYLMTLTASIPSLLKLFISDREEDFAKGKRSYMTSWKVEKGVWFVADFVAFVAQCSAPAIVVVLDFYQDENMERILELVGGLVLVSANQWENFSDGTLFGVELPETSWFKNKVLKIRHELQEHRHFPNSLACLIKIGLTILLTYVLSDDVDMDYNKAFEELSNQEGVYSLKSFSAVIAVTISAFVAFNTALMSLKLQMQRFSFALPLCLVTPATVLVFYMDCKNNFLQTVSDSIDKQNGSQQCADRLQWHPWYNPLIFLVWFLSLLVVCRHIWKRQMDKNSNVNRLFMNPNYCGILTTEQIMLNQRRHQCKVQKQQKFEDNDIDTKSVWYKIDRLATFQSFGSQESQQQQQQQQHQLEQQQNQQQQQQEGANAENPDDAFRPQTNHVTPKIYACATMWHETHTEMVQLLKSLHRLDLDQFVRKYNQDPNRYDPNYYEYEAHIFFDDAMEMDDDNFPVPNKFVKDLVAAMNEACSSVHGKPMRVHDPVKMVTPYGGQLMWRMPGENLLFVHMKDMNKIRNRKRWSQVMYMYYLLHYRLKRFCNEEAVKRMEIINVNKGEQGLNIDEINILLGDEHTARSNKTYVLALDGDTDFLPSSIRILMQRMDEENVGATCGRIHPIGKGPMVWYQKFEYAIGHWLQKASEHVFGCVLCSPGCFSLFRARALMDANVVKRYTTEPTEPSHHLQFDQGEDRWLCTLLLQRGYRIEYAAGADAWTFAPEGFFEFFNQRRRWMPSTIANILDLLATADRTRRVNPNISLPYILYTWLLMLMTLLGPGTILMMMAGAFQLIFSLDITWAYFWSIVPAALFTLACFWLKVRWQLLIAAALSIGYGFIMVIVIVGTIITASTENIFHPSVIIMVCLVAIFIVTGICHPKEWACLTHGILYILCVPSGYLLLVIYSICNLNDVSWGTREVPTKAQKLEMEEKKRKKEEEKLNKKKKSLFKRIFDSSESHISELTSLLKTVMPKTNDGTKLEGQATSLPQDQSIVQILSAIESNTRELLQRGVPGEVSTAHTSKSPQSSSTPMSSADKSASQTTPSVSLAKRKKDGKKTKTEIEKDQAHPRWTQDPGLGKGDVIMANKDEIRFWNGMMEKYLLPIRPSPSDKKKIADGLRDLRNSSAFAFILVNLLWMSLNFMFQLTEAAKINVTYKFGNSEYNVEESILGMSFVFLLLILLLLQFAGMIVHRFGVLQQLLSTTKIWGKNEDVNISNMAEIEDTIRDVKMLLQMPAFNDEGRETQPPQAADEGNPLGLSVKPTPEIGATPMTDDLRQSLRGFGATLDATHNNIAVDWKSDAVLSEVRKRLQRHSMHGRLVSQRGMSYRPDLPPRNMSSTQRNKPWLSSQAPMGITVRDLKRMRPGTTIIQSQTEADKANWRALGPLEKSLRLRTDAILDVQASKTRAQWTTADNAAATNRSGY